MSSLKGKLNESQLRDLDGLILHLKSLNRCNFTASGECKDRLALSEIRPLPAEENERLWKYIRHCCKLAAMTEDSQNKIRKMIVCDERLDVHDLVEDAVNDMSIHVYRYVWRKYKTSNDAGYVMSTAFMGFKTWNDNMVEKMKFDATAKAMFDELNGELSGNLRKRNSNAPERKN